jgi:hypothetical protein
MRRSNTTPWLTFAVMAAWRNRETALTMNMKIIAPSSAINAIVFCSCGIGCPASTMPKMVNGTAFVPRTLSMTKRKACGMNRSKLRARKIVTRMPTSDQVYGL